MVKLSMPLWFLQESQMETAGLKQGRKEGGCGPGKERERGQGAGSSPPEGT